jgi:hypothetical protein
VRTKPESTRPTGVGAIAGRQVSQESVMAVPVQGDALTRYRLGLAWHLGRNAPPQAAGARVGPVTVELSVVLRAGRAIRVEVEDDGGAGALAAWAAQQTLAAIRLVPVPAELGEATVTVGLAMRFEP